MSHGDLALFCMLSTLQSGWLDGECLWQIQQALHPLARQFHMQQVGLHMTMRRTRLDIDIYSSLHILL